MQIGSPSRTEIARYHDLIHEVESEAERINRRFQTSDWKPIVLLKRQHSHQEILPYYRAGGLLPGDFAARRHEPGGEGICRGAR